MPDSFSIPAEKMLAVEGWFGSAMMVRTLLILEEYQGPSAQALECVVVSAEKKIGVA
jgi:hypothetical protein